LEDSETDSEGEDPKADSDILSQINQDAKKEFNRVWGWVDLALNVSKEIQTPYLQCIELPVLHVLTLASYLIAKVKQLESKYKTNQ